ncbi:MAG: hypothetical protein FWB95_02425, partial [Treponema sp.]|nr:hypothetical protein [Treponema sp.]
MRHPMNPKSIFAVLLLTMAVCAYAQYNPESDFTVARSSDGKSITITGYTGTRQTVNIPPAIQGLPVSVIGKEAFALDEYYTNNPPKVDPSKARIRIPMVRVDSA